MACGQGPPGEVMPFAGVQGLEPQKAVQFKHVWQAQLAQKLLALLAINGYISKAERGRNMLFIPTLRHFTPKSMFFSQVILLSRSTKRKQLYIQCNIHLFIYLYLFICFVVIIVILFSIFGEGWHYHPTDTFDCLFDFWWFGEEKVKRGSSKSRRRLHMGQKRNFSKTNLKTQISFSIKYTEQTVY